MKFVRSETVVTREVAGESIVVPVRGGVGDLDGLFTLNEIASGIWQLLATSRSAEEVAEWVRERYEVSEEQARTDVSGFLEELQRQGLVHEA
ncbi:MAG TPA: PqqD family protein [Candidatus Acidoferrales bacterium]|nr:PqqD family protein [Candidatus Acidoferrales bacterium]